MENLNLPTFKVLEVRVGKSSGKTYVKAHLVSLATPNGKIVFEKHKPIYYRQDRGGTDQISLYLDNTDGAVRRQFVFEPLSHLWHEGFEAAMNEWHIHRGEGFVFSHAMIITEDPLDLSW